MARFLNNTDYTALIRNEIKNILLENYEGKLLIAEKMAIAQLKNHLAKRYDTDQIFTGYDEMPDPDPRDYYIIMITIDCTLYHLYTAEAPDRMPQHRSDRYADALTWLKDIRRGDATADLPLKLDNAGVTKMPITIKSKYPPQNHKY